MRFLSCSLQLLVTGLFSSLWVAIPRFSNFCLGKKKSWDFHLLVFLSKYKAVVQKQDWITANGSVFFVWGQTREQKQSSFVEGRVALTSPCLLQAMVLFQPIKRWENPYPCYCCAASGIRVVLSSQASKGGFINILHRLLRVLCLNLVLWINTSLCVKCSRCWVDKAAGAQRQCELSPAKEAEQ